MEKQIEKQDQVKELQEMEKQENVQGQQEMGKQENEQEQQETKKQGQAKEPEQEEMKKQEEAKEPEQQEMKIQEQVQEPEESKKQVEQQEQEREEREQEPEEPSNPPPKKTFSPPRQAELRHAKPSSPPKLPAPAPTPLSHQYSKAKLPPSDSPHKSSPSDSPPHELEDDYDYKKSPFKDPITTTTTAAANLAETITSKAGITSQEFNNQERPGGGNTGSGRTYVRKNLSILKSSKRDSMVNRALLASRIFGFVFSLVSFSVMAADRDRGWALDSFYRYKEFRYCMAVNVIAFVYSGFQGYDTAYQLTSGKRKLRNHLRYYLDFSVDQMLTYLLISASSSAAVRIDDWQSNWGKDEFPRMARASVALSFLAFVALALSSLISGYSVFTLKSV